VRVCVRAIFTALNSVACTFITCFSINTQYSMFLPMWNKLSSIYSLVTDCHCTSAVLISCLALCWGWGGLGQITVLKPCVHCTVFGATPTSVSRRCASSTSFHISGDSNCQTSRHPAALSSQVDSQVFHLPHCQHIPPALEVSPFSSIKLPYILTGLWAV